MFDALGTDVTNDLVAFYVSTHDDTSTGTNTRSGIVPAQYAFPKHVNNVTLAAQGGLTRSTLSHEWLHVLMDAPHDGSSERYLFHQFEVVLEQIKGRRRFKDTHLSSIRASAFVVTPD